MNINTSYKRVLLTGTLLFLIGAQSASSQESTVYHVDLNLDWHYRYYLSPYWYLVPSIHVQYQSIFQTQLKPEYLEHEQLSFTQLSGFIALRRYF